MRYGQVAGVAKPVARLVQGTVMLREENRDGGFALLDAVFAQGGTTFDTAHGYGQGEVERVLGGWLQARGLRDQVVIIGKGAHPYHGQQRVTPKAITSDLHESLERLKTDQIDLYLLHRDNPAVPVGPLVEILNEHHCAGKIGAFGGSNWSHERIAAANDYATEHGLVPFTASSPNFSLAEQFKPPWAGCLSISGAGGLAERQWYREQGMPLFCWSSLAGGFFTGRFSRTNLDRRTTELDRTTVTAYCYEENFQRLDRARALADERGLTIPQIALAYIFNQPDDIYALAGCNSGEEFRDNVAALGVTLSPEECAWLNLERDDRAS